MACLFFASALAATATLAARPTALTMPAAPMPTTATGWHEHPAAG